MPEAQVGGQAVIEGVLMRGPTAWGLAIRTPQGSIHREVWRAPRGSHLAWRVPVLRGFLSLSDMLVMGFKALSFSASVASPEEKFSKRELAAALLLAVTGVVLLFVLLPEMLAQLWAKLAGWGERLVEAISRALSFVAYLALIGLNREVRRMFEYHGAEHKVINAYELGVDYHDLSAVERQSRIHRRCGTSFLLVAVLVSALVFAPFQGLSFPWRALAKAVALPLVAGLSYEVVKLQGKVPILKLLVEPGLWLQRLTTREPSPEQVEVAIAALDEALGASAQPEVV